MPFNTIYDLTRYHIQCTTWPLLGTGNHSNENTMNILGALLDPDPSIKSCILNKIVLYNISLFNFYKVLCGAYTIESIILDHLVLVLIPIILQSKFESGVCVSYKLAQWFGRQWTMLSQQVTCLLFLSCLDILATNIQHQHHSVCAKAKQYMGCSKWKWIDNISIKTCKQVVCTYNSKITIQ